MAAKRSFTLAVAFLVLGACDDGGSSTTSLSRSSSGFDADQLVWNDVIEQVCRKLLSCGASDASDLADCMGLREVQYYLPYIVDPYAFLACFNELPCGSFGEGQDTEEILGPAFMCMGLDLTDPTDLAVQCVGDLVRVCDLYGICRDTSCSSLCERLGAKGGGRCLASETDAPPGCSCSWTFYPNETNTPDALE